MRRVSEVVARLARLGARAEGLFTEVRRLRGAETLLAPLELNKYLDALQEAGGGLLEAREVLEKALERVRHGEAEMRARASSRGAAGE